MPPRDVFASTGHQGIIVDKAAISIAAGVIWTTTKGNRKRDIGLLV